ncbi:MAG: hypothetical protein C4320_00435, partial [Armatimonadota bacterium]
KVTPKVAEPAIPITKPAITEPKPAIPGPKPAIPITKPAITEPAITGPKPSITGPEGDSRVVGISNRHNAADRLFPQKGYVPVPAQVTEAARAKVAAGKADPDALARAIAEGKQHYNAEAVAVLNEGKRLKMLDLNAKRRTLDRAIASGDKAAISEAQKAHDLSEAALHEYVGHVQQGKTEWSNVGRQLQVGVTHDHGDYAGMLARMTRAKGAPLSKAEKAAASAATESVRLAEQKVLEKELEAAKAEIERLSAKRVPSIRAVKRKALDREYEALKADLARIVGKMSAGPDPEIYVQCAKIAVNRIKALGLSVADAADHVLELAKGHGLELDKKALIDAINENTTLSGVNAQIALAQARAEEARKALETGDYSTFETKPRPEYSGPKAKELEYALWERDQAIKKVRRAIADAAPKTWGQHAGIAVDLLRGMKLTADLSALGRQGIFALPAYPKEFTVAAIRAGQAFKSPVKAATMDRAIHTGMKAMRRQKAGLFIAEGESSMGSRAFREEAFAAKDLLNKLPGFNLVHPPSERHYVTMLNELRAQIFDSIADKHPNATLKELKDVAALVNVFTGRGHGKIIDAVAKHGSAVFLAPRFMYSRLQLWPLLLKHIVFGNPLTQKVALRMALSQIATYASLFPLAKAAGAEVSYDPESPDFLKIKLGNTRIDILGGLQGNLRQASLTSKHLAKDKADPQLGKRMFKIYVRNKLNPIISLMFNLFEGKDAVGQPFLRDKHGKITPKAIAEDTAKEFVPLSIRDIAEITTDSKTKGGAKAIGIASTIGGFGVQNYQAKPKKANSGKAQPFGGKFKTGP